MASAGLAPDGEQVASQVPNLAYQLAERKAPDKAEQLYRALFPLFEARAVDNIQPLQQALSQYVLFDGTKEPLGRCVSGNRSLSREHS
jgi:hypothetical protein